MNNPKEAYRIFAGYYDLYVHNFAEDLEFYTSVCTKSDEIIEVGCGTGRVLNHFLQNNFNITGVDISSEMLEIAKNKLVPYINDKKLTLINHDFSENTLQKRFNKALVTFYTFNYIIDRPVVFLQNIRKCMRKSGKIYLDMFYPFSFIDPSIENKWTEKEFKIKGRTIILKDKRYVKDNLEYRKQVYLEKGKEITIETLRKYYSPLDIGIILKNAGFSDINYSYTYNRSLFTGEITEKKLNHNFVVSAVNQ